MSIEKSFETSQTPHLIIGQIHGNLQLRAWEESRVSVSGNGDDYRFKQEGDQIVLGDFEDCRIFVPIAASVTLGDVHGNAQVTGVRGQLKGQRIHGNLRGEEIGAIQLGKVDGDYSVREVAGPLVLGSANGNFHATEVKGNVQLEQCGGNCMVREVEGHVTLGRVRGNLSIQETMTVTVDSVHGNASLKESNGNVQIQKVAGNVVATEIAGDLDVESIGGELRVRELAGSLNARVGGNATLYLQNLPTPQVVVQAGGDIRCRVPLTLDAKVEVRAGNEVVIKNLPLPNEWNSRAMQFTVGNGEGRLELEAGNRIKLVGTDVGEVISEWGFEDEFYGQYEFNERAAEMVQQVAEQVEAQVEAVTRQLNERLSQLDSGDAIAAKVQQKVQAAMRRAEEKIAEAMRRAEHQAERQAERQAARQERRGVRVMTPFPSMPSVISIPPTPPTPPQPPKPKRAPASGEERMMVLRMVEEGKISVEQAEKLLSAMGD